MNLIVDRREAYYARSAFIRASRELDFQRRFLAGLHYLAYLRTLPKPKAQSIPNVIAFGKPKRSKRA
jgi:hypothetical protein